MRTQVRKKNHNITYGTMPEFILTFEIPMGNIVKLSPHRWSRYFATIVCNHRRRSPYECADNYAGLRQKNLILRA